MRGRQGARLGRDQDQVQARFLARLLCSGRVHTRALNCSRCPAWLLRCSDCCTSLQLQLSCNCYLHPQLFSSNRPIPPEESHRLTPRFLHSRIGAASPEWSRALSDGKGALVLSVSVVPARRVTPPIELRASCRIFRKAQSVARIRGVLSQSP